MSNEMLTKIDGVYYREVARRAKVGELIKITSSFASYGRYSNGDVFKVEKGLVEGVEVEDRSIYILNSEYVVLEPVARDKCAREFLAEEKRNNEIDEIAQLGLRLAKVSRKLDEIQRDVREMVYGKTKRKPAKPTRDDVIKRARADVAKLSRGLDLRFRINREGRSVVARISTSDRYKDLVVRVLQSRGIARCSPGDVFNIHIGKAIALRRALGLEVFDEYVNAPMPVNALPGDVVDLLNVRSRIVLSEKLRLLDDQIETDDARIVDDSRTGTEREDYGL